MNKSKKFLNLTKRDVGLILGFGALAAILNVYPFPYVAAGTAVLAILLVRMSEATDEQDEHAEPPVRDERSIEKRSAEEIIMSKLNGGAIEQAIDERFDKMVQDVVDDLFGNHGGVSREIKAKLKETMNPYIEQHDFSEHTVKLEHLLNQLVTEITKEQDTLTRNLRDMMGTEPVTEVSTSGLFDRYVTYIGENIDTTDLDIDYDDEPTYQRLNAQLECEDERSINRNKEKKLLIFTCKEDEDMGYRIGIQRWTDLSDKAWHIYRIERLHAENASIKSMHHDDKDLTLLDTPMKQLSELNELEVYLLKLHYDQAEIVLDETDIYDDDVEVEEEPEAYLA